MSHSLPIISSEVINEGTKRAAGSDHVHPLLA